MAARRFSALVSGPHRGCEHGLARRLYTYFPRTGLGSAGRAGALGNDAQILDYDRTLLRRYLERLGDWTIPRRGSYHCPAPSRSASRRARPARAGAVGAEG